MVVMDSIANFNLARRIAMFNAEANMLEPGSILFSKDNTKQIKQKMVERDKLLFIIKSRNNNIIIDKILSNPEQKIKCSVKTEDIMSSIETV